MAHRTERVAKPLSSQLDTTNFKVVCKFTDLQNALAEAWTGYVTSGRISSVRMGIVDLRQRLDQLEEIIGPDPRDEVQS